MLCHKQRKVRVSRLPFRVLIAVSVYRDDPVGVFIHHDAPWIHAERPHQIAVFFCAVNDLALIQFIGKVREYFRGKLYAHADIDAVGLCPDVQRPANGFHPFASAPAGGDHALFAVIGLFSAVDPVPSVYDLHPVDSCVKTERHFLF